MSYTLSTDFLTLLRQTSGGERLMTIPGLDYVVSAMARSGMFTLLVGQTAPIVNQSMTVWLKPSIPSWVQEGTVYLWNPNTAQYELATLALWSQLFTNLSNTNLFQAVNAATGTVLNGATLVAVKRAAPTATALQLPSVVNQNGKILRVIDWSTSVTNHDITLTTFGTETINQQPTWQLLSTAVQLSGVALYPSIDLNAWVIAP